jgi:hypothetical protein
MPPNTIQQFENTIKAGDAVVSGNSIHGNNLAQAATP